MKAIWFLSIVLCSGAAVAQEPVRTLFDKETKLPVSFATIKILNSPKGTITNEDGSFQLTIELSDSVFITSVGYQSIILIGKNMSQKLYIEPIVKQLSEVIAKHQKLLRTLFWGNGVEYLDEKIKCPCPPCDPCEPWGLYNKTEFAEKIEVPGKEAMYKIKTIYIPVQKKDCTNPLLLHIYLADPEDEFPGEEILTKPIAVNLNRFYKDKIVVDMSAENIYVDKSFFISIGWMPATSPKKCNTLLPLIKSEKKNTYSRTLSSLTYEWFNSGIRKDSNGNIDKIRTNTFYAVEVEEFEIEK